MSVEEFAKDCDIIFIGKIMRSRYSDGMSYAVIEPLKGFIPHKQLHTTDSSLVFDFGHSPKSESRFGPFLSGEVDGHKVVLIYLDLNGDQKDSEYNNRFGWGIYIPTSNTVYEYKKAKMTIEKRLPLVKDIVPYLRSNYMTFGITALGITWSVKNEIGILINSFILFIILVFIFKPFKKKQRQNPNL